MPYPTPEPGLVIGYSYLWKNESDEGAVEGLKDRPCTIIFSVLNKESEQIITVLPITHTEPHDNNDGVEIPQATRKRLGLDGERSWIIVSELNKFVWPGPDMRPISRRDNSQYSYGFLPPALYDLVKKKLIASYNHHRLSSVLRTE